MNISKAVHRLIGQVDELHFYFRGKFSEVKMLCEGCEFNCRKAVNFISIYDKILLYSSENLFTYHFSPPESLTEEELTGFRTSLREVFTFIKYSQNKDKIDILLRENNAYEFLDRTAVNVLKN